MLKYVWLVVMILFLIIEGMAPGLICIWFSFGALIAFLASLIGVGFSAQLIIFFVAALAFVIALRPLAAKYLNHSKGARTNADAYIDRECLVTEEINELTGKGQVSVAGKVWSARSEDGSSIPVGSKVRSLRIEGVKLIVRKEKQEV